MMWTLVGAQFRYYAVWMLSLVVPGVLFAVAVTLEVDDPVRAGKMWTIFTLVFGVTLQIVCYQKDIRERRSVLLMELPVTPTQVAAARLMQPLLLQSGLLGMALFSLALLEPTALTGPPLGKVLSGNGLAMLVSFALYAFEEIGIYLAEHKTWFWLSQMAFSAAIVVFALNPWGTFPDLDAPAGLACLYGAALVCALASYVLFKNRPNFLIGTDPNCGLPVNWSRGE